MWKLKKKVLPRPPEVTTGKKDNEGRLITNPDKLKSLILNHFVDRLKHREMLPHLKKLQFLREEILSFRLENTKLNTSPEWSMKDLENVLKKLKNGKSRDPAGLVNEIFKLDNIGTDLKESILILMNKIKTEMEEPDFMEDANIVTIFKGKGSRSDLINDRGIFLLNILRTIKDKLIHEDIKDVLDKNMSDSQVGSRKEKGIRNHLFIAHSVINHAKQTKSNIDITLYDLRQCFDGLWLEECLNDLYENGIKDDKLNMIFRGNQNNNVSVKLPIGESERVPIKNVVTQGGPLGVSLCSVTVDTIGKEALDATNNETNDEEYIYKYHDAKIPPLSMVDDLLTVSKCGPESIMTNAFVLTSPIEAQL